MAHISDKIVFGFSIAFMVLFAIPLILAFFLTMPPQLLALVLYNFISNTLSVILLSIKIFATPKHILNLTLRIIWTVIQGIAVIILTLQAISPGLIFPLIYHELTFDHPLIKTSCLLIMIPMFIYGIIESWNLNRACHLAQGNDENGFVYDKIVFVLSITFMVLLPLVPFVFFGIHDTPLPPALALAIYNFISTTLSVILLSVKIFANPKHILNLAMRVIWTVIQGIAVFILTLQAISPGFIYWEPRSDHASIHGIIWIPGLIIIIPMFIYGIIESWNLNRARHLAQGSDENGIVYYKLHDNISIQDP